METTTHGTHKQPNYMAVWVALFVLTIAELGVAFLSHLPKALLIGILLFLAIWKALLVALYYMHLKFEPKRLWLLAASPLPLILIFLLVILYEGWRV
jgi:cytochrome c oxidase subunit IV